MARTIRRFLVGLLLVTAAGLRAQTPSQPSAVEITLGQAAVPLYTPWKFTIGDSPLNPKTGKPLWAEPDFDDSGWEILSRLPADATRNVNDASNFIPGFTARGHEPQPGFAWYRMRLSLETFAREELALAGPEHVDAYQVYVNGNLLGGFGDFTPRRPVTYYKQPMMFRFTTGAPNSAPIPAVIAFRVWTQPNPLLTSHAAGGFRSAPLIGEVNAVTIHHQQRRQDLILSYSPFVIDALIYALLAIVALSLLLFDRSDHVYSWMGLVFIFTSTYSALGALDVWTQHVSIFEDLIFVRCLLGPVAYVCWFMVWWVWFRRTGPRWMPLAAIGVTVAYAASYAILINLFSSPVPHAVITVVLVMSLIARVLYFVLLSSIVLQGIRTAKLEGWLVVPVIILLAIAPFQNELSILQLSPSWSLFGTRLDLPEIASLILAAVVALLLLRRLWLSVRRQRLIELDANRAQLQSDFVAAVSHEFRSPLTTLRSVTDLLVQGRITDEARRQQSYVFLDRETTRLQRFVEDLLDFGRMESRRKQYRLSTFDAFQLVRDAVSDLREETDAEGFCIQTSFVVEGASIHADEEAVRRAIRNLIENAMKYSPQCQTIWVNGSVEGTKVCIAVRDQGMGIGAHEQQAIFQKFVRGAAAKQAGIKGTGIGLAMVRQIIEAMHGEIRLKSEIGVGSTFTLVLPLAEK